jgi:hypothetical protein
VRGGKAVAEVARSYTWDRANRLLTAPGSHSYDGDGRRIQKTVSSTVTQ